MGDDRRPLILITGCSTGIGWEAAKLLGGARLSRRGNRSAG
ncbi:MAG: hypothetical protein M5R36_20110 [Deltaproteobacteria bacterium]|nr:hypothetical protein [Deltaproteobacteria bacterium]